MALKYFVDIGLRVIRVPHAFRIDHHCRPKFTPLQAATLIDPYSTAQTKRLTLGLHVGLQGLRTTSAAGASRVTRCALVDTAEHVNIVVMTLTG